MTAQLGIMIEAQEGLTWEYWRAIVRDSERLGFASLRCSDHCFSVLGVEGRDSLPAWAALALAAEWSNRIQLGPMVSPMTFYHPAVLARMARAVDELSGGRLILGLGAGWYAAEHERYAIPFPSLRERFDRLEAGVERIQTVLTARSIPLLIGGGGERRTLPLAARVAAEWNVHGVDPDGYRAKSNRLDELCRAAGRDPRAVRRSLMCGYLIGRDERDLRKRAGRLAAVLPNLQGLTPDEVLASLRTRPWLVGTRGEIAKRAREYASAGVELILVQHFVLDDADALEQLAEVRDALA